MMSLARWNNERRAKPGLCAKMPARRHGVVRASSVTSESPPICSRILPSNRFVVVSVGNSGMHLPVRREIRIDAQLLQSG